MSDGPGRDPVERLLRGMSTDHVETVRDAWRALLADGARAVPVIRDKLGSDIWATHPRGPLPRYLGVLLALLDTLDPAAFADEVARLKAASLHPVHRLTVDTLSQRLRDRPVTHVAGDIPVYVASDIPDRDGAARTLARWCRTPGLSLEGVTRIDVIARRPELDYLGKYNLFFSGIILTWHPETARGIPRWWRRLNDEFTFYHEVGHHACGHLEGGQVAEQEREADDYARSMMRRSRPVLTGIGRALLFPLGPLIRRLGAS